MTREDAINNLNMIRFAFVEAETKEQRKIIDDTFNMAIKALEQEPKSGHWKAVSYNSNHGEYRPPKYACSECGWEIDLCRGLQQDTGHRLFCEHCGAKMFEPQERGDKE